MKIVVDFDGTLALGNKSHITLSEPNYSLIKKLQNLKSTIDCKIIIVTARGSKNKLSNIEKIKKYQHLIENFCQTYCIPYDEISFNKEYADLYIDDMTIDQNANFSGIKSEFTNNKIIFTEKSVIKKCSSSLFEKEWYEIAKNYFHTPDVLFCNDETIITSKINGSHNINIKNCIEILNQFKNLSIRNFDYQTYIDNIHDINYTSTNTRLAINYIKNNKLYPTFFHGDFNKKNIIQNSSIYLIDPNYKYIFGNYLTDAAKLYFSIVAYEKNYQEAQQLVKEFGKTIIYYAIAEGLRVCKYKPNFISIVNNISESI